MIGYDDTIGRPFSGGEPARNLGLFQGEPWIAGSDDIYRHDGVTWKKMPFPARKSTVYVSGFRLHNNQLYTAPDPHRWTGSDWEPLLPECVGGVLDATISTSGQWLLAGSDSLGCGFGPIVLYEGDSLRSIGLPDVKNICGTDWLELYAKTGLAFDSTTPVFLNHRYIAGEWVPIANRLPWNPMFHYADEEYPDNETVLFPGGPGSALYALAPGWLFARPIEYSSDPCSNRLFRLADSGWVPMSGWFDHTATLIAPWRDSGVIIAGGFGTDHTNFVSDGLAGFDGESWHTFPGTSGVSYDGVEGDVLDVELQGDSLWLGGAGLSTFDQPSGHPLLLYTQNRWQQIPGISGVIRQLEVHDGRLYAGGDLVVGLADTTSLAVLGNQGWQSIATERMNVEEMKSSGGALYIGGWRPAGGGDTSRSWLYRLGDGDPEVLLKGWRNRLLTFEIVDSTIYVGTYGGLLGSLENGVVHRLQTFDGGTLVEDGYGGYQVGPSVDALLWHQGWLYVGGSFHWGDDDFRAGSIARYRGGGWEALDSGVAVSRTVYRFWCDSVAYVCRVRELLPVGDRILAAGSFRYISTLIDWRYEYVTGGERVDLPLALYDPATNTWEAAALPHSSRRLSDNTITGIDIAEGRLAIGGEFTMRTSMKGAFSRNVALTDRIVSVPPIRAPEQRTDLSFHLLHRNGRLLLETKISTRLTAELYDVNGRLLAQLFDEVFDIGQREITLPEEIRGAVLIVVRDEEGRSVGEIVPGR